jgi:hypothetical protein
MRHHDDQFRSSGRHLPEVPVSPRGVPVDPAERANRILDAATRLLLRYGHDRTTIGDIAREAGVAKGSIVDLLEKLRAGGWIRTDRSLAEQVTVLSTVYLGFFLTEPLLPVDFHIPNDAVPDLVADTVWRALERPEPLTPDEVAAVDRAVHDHMTAATAAAEERLRDPQSSGEERT